MRRRNDERLYEVDETVKEVVMNTHIIEAQDRIFKLHRAYLLATEVEVYGNLS